MSYGFAALRPGEDNRILDAMGGQITRRAEKDALHKRFLYDIPGQLYRLPVLLFQMLQFMPRGKYLQITL